MGATLLKNGDKIGDRYEIVDFIGEGGMQEVYRANDLTFARDVALKAPKNTSASKRFSRSATVSARVTHGNVAKTLDYISTAERDYLVEEYIDGHNLQQRLDDEFLRLDPHLGAHCIHHITKGLAASHHAGVLHRDLKPSNVMVSNDPHLGVIKITDFGIAKMAEEEIDQAVEAGDDESITGSKTVIGALPYMAPELFETSAEISFAADIWAVGALLYHLLVGERPFGVGLQAIPKIIKAELPDKKAVLKVNQQFEGITGDLWKIIEACLRKNQSERPTGDELLQMFSKICYSTAARNVGRIYNFRARRGDWGFIKDQSGKDYFFHRDSFYGGTPKDGMSVNFACFAGTPRHRAFPVVEIRPPR